MVHTAKTFDERRDSSLRNAEPRANGFKPLALPALAAAVRVTGRSQARKPAYREIPAILREDALTD
jgi:hypothetical protein